jgi:transcriptional regulator with XRE-family HTH domain
MKRTLQPEVMKLLRERGLTVGALAERAGVSRPHLSLVLRNVPGRGGQVRRKVARHLVERELTALGWDVEGNLK